ncbi:hypothetical protein EMIHUDRAFT_229660 [Emiliania huxleyi CCMP1516]|uniref:Uncharacterized protein n=2 Tax=Emiliania huxleyi TaxID=2903 RepID=A0A0D3KCM7_EMIH1|nr:hypothetical protein EMIHUDRAFT_229660 [Emiliania huxleyi CCMP1516]EOD33512.1 hypothetical protein EMIHUDRAFT_229660 [Emiliania huxleyi CCMP1516]|eukprot:XP_005785941.1 hypothetical protein EMIHUDRAFT_229660 [Emiliania huxleyi CCMP1516]
MRMGGSSPLETMAARLAGRPKDAPSPAGAPSRGRALTRPGLTATGPNRGGPAGIRDVQRMTRMARVESLAAGGEPNMRLTALFDDLAASFASIEDVVSFGINANTFKGRASVADPRSALAYPLAIVRVFGRWGVKMPSYKALVAELNGLMRLYLMYPYSLMPKRAEPMRWGMVIKMDRLPLDGRIIGGYAWDDSVHRVFTFRRLSRFLFRTAFRLGEICGHASGEIMYLTRSSVVWRINVIIHSNPSRALLRSMVPNRDGCLVTPPRCPFTIFIGLSAREEAAAKIYTWHSYCSGLSTALHAAGVPDAVIMLMCRWMCEASLHVYRRSGAVAHEANFWAATRADVSNIQAANVPNVVMDQGMADVADFCSRQCAADKAAYYACKEFGGAGWAATVLRCSKHTAIVRFTYTTGAA